MKDRELQELYRTIEQLRLQGNQLEHNNHQNNQQTNGNNGTPSKNKVI